MDADHRLSAGAASAEDEAALAKLLDECEQLDASDLHLVPGSAPIYRVHGELLSTDGAAALDAAAVERLCRPLLARSGTSGLEGTGSQDGAMTAAGGARFRFNVYRRMGGLSVALRRLEERFRGLAELGMPESLYALCDAPNGMVVIAGPTGAGKSTTLAALIDHINRTRRVHVITIEDPIEYIHTPVRSVINQRQVGADASTFNDALVASLREDPDVILVGEVRDLDTIRTAIRAAETGHLVLTTVHAGDCVGALERLVSVFPAGEQAGIRQQLALVLRAIVAQRLLPLRDPNASGRAVASEILVTTPAVANLAATGRSAQIYTAMEGGGPHGMQTLEQDLARLLVTGRISEATAYAAARSPNLVRERAQSMRRAPTMSRGDV